MNTESNQAPARERPDADRRQPEPGAAASLLHRRRRPRRDARGTPLPWRQRHRQARRCRGDPPARGLHHQNSGNVIEITEPRTCR